MTSRARRTQEAAADSPEIQAFPDAACGSIGSLSALVEASHAVTDELPIVLRSILDVARSLLDAPYAAMTVLASERHEAEQFIHVGFDEATADRIGHPPSRDGLLGSLIHGLRPIRLDEVLRDPRAVGFPDHHPVLRSIVGVPITDHGRVVGSIYLARSEQRPFTQRDEEVVQALAATAACVLGYARQHRQRTRLEECLLASHDFMVDLIKHERIANTQLLAEQARVLAEADWATVTTLDSPALDLGSFAADGHGPAEPGPMRTFAISGVGATQSVLTIARDPGRGDFSEGGVEAVRLLVEQVGLAVELAEAGHDEQLATNLQERIRTVRDRYQHVIHALFVAGLTLQGTVGRPQDQVAARITDVIDLLDGAIRDVRSAALTLLSDDAPQGASVT